MQNTLTEEFKPKRIKDNPSEEALSAWFQGPCSYPLLSHREMVVMCQEEL